MFRLRHSTRARTSPELVLARHILRLVLDRLNENGTEHEAVPVGGIYLVDRFATGGYAFLRRRGTRGRDRVVLLVKPRPSRRSVELQAPIALAAAERLTEAILGRRARTVKGRSAFDVTRTSLIDLLVDRIAQLVEGK